KQTAQDAALAIALQLQPAPGGVEDLGQVPPGIVVQPHPGATPDQRLQGCRRLSRTQIEDPPRLSLRLDDVPIRLPIEQVAIPGQRFASARLPSRSCSLSGVTSTNPSRLCRSSHCKPCRWPRPTWPSSPTQRLS